MAACQAAGFSPVPQVEAADPAAVRELAPRASAWPSCPRRGWPGPGPRPADAPLAAPAPVHRTALLVAPGASPAGRLLAARLPDLLGRAG